MRVLLRRSHVAIRCHPFHFSISQIAVIQASILLLTMSLKICYSLLRISESSTRNSLALHFVLRLLSFVMVMNGDFFTAFFSSTAAGMSHLMFFIFSAKEDRSHRQRQKMLTSIDPD